MFDYFRDDNFLRDRELMCVVVFSDSDIEAVIERSLRKFTLGLDKDWNLN